MQICPPEIPNERRREYKTVVVRVQKLIAQSHVLADYSKKTAKHVRRALHLGWRQASKT